MIKWNAYKVFNNGKRAKGPTKTFEAEDAQHFYNEILPSLSTKLQKTKWLVVNDDEPQERKAEKIDEEKERKKEITKFVLEHMAAKGQNRTGYASNKIMSCLMLSKDIGWKWAWCLAEIGTMKYVISLSPHFSTDTEAEKWIEEKYKELKQ